MPRDASGNYTLPAGNPVVTGTTVASGWANPTMSDVGAEVQDSLSRSGNGAMLAPLKHVDGTKGAPAITFNSAATTGWYRAGADDVRFAVAGNDVIRVTATGMEFYNAVDAVWYSVPDSKSTGGIYETQALSVSQTVVPFTLNIAGASIFQSGGSADRGRLLLTDDYTYDSVANEITLIVPAVSGQKLTAVVNDESQVQAAATAASASAVAAAASETQTGLDAVATAADRVQTGLDATATAADAVATAADRVQTGLDVVATAADVVSTNADAAATANDVVQTTADVLSTGADATATAADRVQTGLDATATAADLVQTNQDTIDTAADAAAAAASAAIAAANAQTTIPARNGALNQEAVDQTTGVQTGMSSTTYTGNGTSQSVNTGVGMSTGDLGGLVWLKARDTADSHSLFDTVRAAGEVLTSDATSAEATTGAMTSFDATGFSVSGGSTRYNANTNNYVAWSFQTNQKTSGLTNRNKAYTAHYNADMGFSIVGYEGDGVAGHEIPHHLGQEPEFRITKSRGNVVFWLVNGKYIGDETAGDLLQLEATGAVANAATAGVITTDTTASLGSSNVINLAGDNFIQYNFRSVEGVSKIGKYIGTGAAGNYVDCGFKAGFVIIKNLTTAVSWVMIDNGRGDNLLLADTSGSEVAEDTLDFVDTGLTLKGASQNTLNEEYLFLAFADSGSGDTTYEYPLTDDQLAIRANTLLSFAEGFNAQGQVDTQEYTTSTTVNLGAGFENQHLWMYKDKAGNYGFSEYRPLVGETRDTADKWGVASPVDASLRTTDKHFDYESATGVASASGEDRAAWQAFSKVDSPYLESVSSWRTPNTTGWLQYKSLEKRVLKSWRLKRGSGTTENPRRFTIEGSNDGLNWTPIDSTYAASDFTGNGADLWSDTHDTSGNTSAYLYHRINITANNGGANTVIKELEFNTILPADYFLVPEGKMYNSAGTEIDRIYLAEVRTGGSGDVTYLRNLTAAKQDFTEVEIQDGLTVHGEITNRGVCTAWVNFDGTQNPPLIRDSYNIADVVDVGLGQFNVLTEEVDLLSASVSVSKNQSQTNCNAAPNSSSSLFVAVRNDAGTFVDPSHMFVQVFGGKEIK